MDSWPSCLGPVVPWDTVVGTDGHLIVARGQEEKMEVQGPSIFYS